MDTRIQKSSLFSPLSHGMRRIQNMRIQNCFWILVSKMMRGVSIFTCVLQQLLKINVSKRIQKTKKRIQKHISAYPKSAVRVSKKRIQKNENVSKSDPYRIQTYPKISYPKVSKTGAYPKKHISKRIQKLRAQCPVPPQAFHQNPSKSVEILGGTPGKMHRNL